MARFFYPAVFHRETNGYSVSFPDLPGCLTEGTTLEDAYLMAQDALGLYLKDNTADTFARPHVSSIESISTCAGDTLLLVEFDEIEYLKRNSGKAVKKTLSIPSWLNESATAAGLNFSQVLQEALKERLNLV